MCAYWRLLAAHAFTSPDPCDYVILLGDDVELLDGGWQEAAVQAFEDITADVFSSGLNGISSSNFNKNSDCSNYQRACAPGFGVVIFRDETFPGFPSFPIISRMHAHILASNQKNSEDFIKNPEEYPQIFPVEFANQDADPFLFALYRRFGAVRHLSQHGLKNHIGGSAPPRYVLERSSLTRQCYCIYFIFAVHSMNLVYRYSNL